MKEYGICTKCLLPWYAEKYWNSKYQIWYKGCSKCRSMLYWSGGVI